MALTLGVFVPTDECGVKGTPWHVTFEHCVYQKSFLPDKKTDIVNK